MTAALVIWRGPELVALFAAGGVGGAAGWWLRGICARVKETVG